MKDSLDMKWKPLILLLLPCIATRREDYINHIGNPNKIEDSFIDFLVLMVALYHYTYCPLIQALSTMCF